MPFWGEGGGVSYVRTKVGKRAKTGVSLEFERFFKLCLRVSDEEREVREVHLH